MTHRSVLRERGCTNANCSQVIRHLLTYMLHIALMNLKINNGWSCGPSHWVRQHQRKSERAWDEMKRHQHSTGSTARTTTCPSLYWLDGFAPVARIPKTEREIHHHWRARNDKQAGRRTNDRDRCWRRRGRRRRRRGNEQARASRDPAMAGAERTRERAAA